MKTLTLLLAASVLLGGCDKRKEVVRISDCKNGYQRYDYRSDSFDWEYFYAPCGQYHIGQQLFTDSIKSK